MQGKFSEILVVYICTLFNPMAWVDSHSKLKIFSYPHFVGMTSTTINSRFWVHTDNYILLIWFGVGANLQSEG